MKKIKGFVATFLLLIGTLLFSQCAKNQATSSTVEQKEITTERTSDNQASLVYVDIDSLLNRYEFSRALNKEMLRKEENMRMTLNEKAKSLQTDYDDFQRKLQNNVYATRERAEEEQARIMKKKEALDALQERLATELAAESQKNNLQLRDSINSFLKEFNKKYNYDFIISRVGDNLLLANPKLDITNEVIQGLNARYIPKSE